MFSVCSFSVFIYESDGNNRRYAVLWLGWWFSAYFFFATSGFEKQKKTLVPKNRKLHVLFKVTGLNFDACFVTCLTHILGRINLECDPFG